MKRPFTALQTTWLNEHFHDGRHVEAHVHAVVKGGVRVRLDHDIEAFLPHSLTAIRPKANLASLVGTTLSVRIVKVTHACGNAVVDRRGVEEMEWGEARFQWMTTHGVGDVVQGTVLRILPGAEGAIVHLTNGVEAYVPAREMGWLRSTAWSGEEIGAVWHLKVLAKDNGRIVCSRKTDNPWSMLKSETLVGTVLSGRVYNIVDYGLFVEIPNIGVTGLIPVSELPKNTEAWPRVGTEIRCGVDTVDTKAQRMTLSPMMPCIVS